MRPYLPTGPLAILGRVSFACLLTLSGLIQISQAQSTSGQLLNISTRVGVQSGDNVLIGGFIITGTDPKKVIVRGIGPSLANLGITGFLEDPKLELHAGNGATLDLNDNWKSDHQAEIEATSVPPSHDLEAAIVQSLPAHGANYTAIVSGKSNTSGIGVVEVYDLDQAANAKLANISTRGVVETGDNVLIGGFIIGNGATKVLVRGIGPSLVNAGIANPLQDPTLELFNGSGTSIATNDDWKATQPAEIAATGIPPNDNRESAILRNLAPGNYTAVVRGKDNTTGIAVVEAFDIPCQGVVTQYPLQPGVHVPVGTVITNWNSNPPTSGQHYPTWGRWNRTWSAAAPLPRGHYVHNAEHGGIVLLYNCPDGCVSEVNAMQSLLAGLPIDPMCTAPGVSTRTLITADPSLPPGVTFAAVACCFAYTADCFDAQSIRDFILAHYAQGPENTCAEG